MTARDNLSQASRLVVKLGTGVLTDSRKQPEPEQMEQLVRQLAAQRQAGREIVLDSSGAVGNGMGALGYQKRPKALAELQACAAVGQSRLMAAYEKLFARHQLTVAQVVLTHDDLQHHERHPNARNTLDTLLDHGVIPIINENDAISSSIPGGRELPDEPPARPEAFLPECNAPRLAAGSFGSPRCSSLGP